MRDLRNDELTAVSGGTWFKWCKPIKYTPPKKNDCKPVKKKYC